MKLKKMHTLVRINSSKSIRNLELILIKGSEIILYLMYIFLKILFMLSKLCGVFVCMVYIWCVYMCSYIYLYKKLRSNVENLIFLAKGAFPVLMISHLEDY